jgi:hypothetical protein
MAVEFGVVIPSKGPFGEPEAIRELVSAAEGQTASRRVG